MKNFIFFLLALISQVAFANSYVTTHGAVDQVDYNQLLNGTTQLVATSNQVQVFATTDNGSFQILKMSDAQHLPNDWWLEVQNNSPGFVTVRDNGGNFIASVGSSRIGKFFLKSNATVNGQWVYNTPAAIADIITDHGQLSGLGDDDHPQYLNDARGDAKYFKKTEFIDTSSGTPTDAGKPVKTSTTGLIDDTLLPAAAGNAWQRTGNLATDPTTDYVGTADDIDMIIGRNARRQIQLGTGFGTGLTQFYGHTVATGDSYAFNYYATGSVGVVGSITVGGGIAATGNIAAIGTVTGSNLSGTNTGDLTIGTANGLSLVGQDLSLAAASGSTTGALLSTDWTTFNNKQPAGNYITALTSDVSASGPGSAAATVNSVGGSTAANVHTAELIANAAASANTLSAVVRRDSTGGFSAGRATFDSVYVTPSSASTVPVTIQGAASQTGDLLDIVNSAGIKKFSIDRLGNATANAVAIDGNLKFQTRAETTATLNSMVATASLVRLGSGVSTINGIAASRDGTFIALYNASGGAITISHESSSATNVIDRIHTSSGSDLSLAASQSVGFIYDGVLARWKTLFSPSSGGSSGGAISEYRLTDFSLASGWGSTDTSVFKFSGSAVTQANTGTGLTYSNTSTAGMTITIANGHSGECSFSAWAGRNNTDNPGVILSINADSTARTTDVDSWGSTQGPYLLHKAQISGSLARGSYASPSWQGKCSAGDVFRMHGINGLTYDAGGFSFMLRE